MNNNTIQSNLSRLNDQILRLDKAISFNLGMGKRSLEESESFTDSEIISNLHSISTVTDLLQFKQKAEEILKHFFHVDDQSHSSTTFIGYNNFDRILSIIDNDMILSNAQKNLVKSIIHQFKVYVYNSKVNVYNGDMPQLTTQPF